MDELLGQDRRDALNQLRREWARVRRERTPGLVAVNVPEGGGRTHFLQHWYAMAAIDQPHPGYWPASLQDDEVWPESAKAPQGARLPWLWIGLKGRVSESKLQEDIETQVDKHADHVRRAMAADEEAQRQGRLALVQLVGIGAGVSGLLPLAAPVALAISVATLLFDSAEAAQTIRKALRATGGSDTSEGAKRRGADPEPGGPAEDAMEKLAASLGAVASRVPIMLVVDDADKLTSPLRYLVDSLTEFSQPIMVVLVGDAAPDGWMRDIHEDDDTLPLSLGPLTHAELAQLAPGILAQELPAARDKLTELVPACGGLPGLLADALQGPAIRTSVMENVEFPAPLHELLSDAGHAALLEGMDADVRRALVVLGLVNDASTRPLLETVVSPGALDAAIASGHVWHDDAGCVRFSRWRMRLAALSDRAKTLTGPQVEQIAKDYADAVQQADLRNGLDGLPSDVLEAVWLSAVPEHPWFGVRLRELRAAAGRSSDNADLLEILQRSSSEKRRDPRLIAQLLVDIGRFSGAVQELEVEVAERMERGLTVRDLGVVEDLGTLLAHHGKRLGGQPEGHPVRERAAALFCAALALNDQRPATGDPKARVNAEMDIRWKLAHTLADDNRHGGPDGAVHHAEIVVKHRVKAYGARARVSLSARHSLAYWCGESGDHDHAIAQYEDLLPDCTEILGPHHPNTLTTRHNLATLYGRSGDHERAIRDYEELLPDLTKILGPHHPDTLTTRNSLAGEYGDSGDHERAIRDYEELLPDRTEILGPHHPDTLTTRHNLAKQYGHSGDHNRAIAQYEDLLPDRTEILGPHHPGTLTTRHNLAGEYAASGDHTRAITEMESVVHDCENHLDAGDPLSQSARMHLQIFRQMASERDEE